jgi:hypothetical protein
MILHWIWNSFEEKNTLYTSFYLLRWHNVSKRSTGSKSMSMNNNKIKSFQIPQSELNESNINIRLRIILTTQNVKKEERFSLHTFKPNKSNNQTRPLIWSLFVFFNKTFCPNCRTRFINVKYNSDNISRFFPWPHSSTKQTHHWWTLKKDFKSVIISVIIPNSFFCFKTVFSCFIASRFCWQQNILKGKNCWKKKTQRDA